MNKNKSKKNKGKKRIRIIREQEETKKIIRTVMRTRLGVAVKGEKDVTDF